MTPKQRAAYWAAKAKEIPLPRARPPMAPGPPEGPAEPVPVLKVDGPFELPNATVNVEPKGGQPIVVPPAFLLPSALRPRHPRRSATMFVLAHA